MRTGRPRRPTEAKILEGTFRPDRANPDEPKPDHATPTCPSWLNASAKTHWRFMVRELRAMRLLAKVDQAVLAGFCQSWARYEQAEAVIERYGLTMCIETRGGGSYEQQRPEVSIAQKALSQMQALGREVGWSASARGSLKVQPAEEAKPKTMKEMLRGNTRRA